jgi:hypothetical protein
VVVLVAVLLSPVFLFRGGFSNCFMWNVVHALLQSTMGPIGFIAI